MELGGSWLIDGVVSVFFSFSLDDVGDEASDMEGKREQQAERAAAEGDRRQDLRRTEDVREF